MKRLATCLALYCVLVSPSLSSGADLGPLWESAVGTLEKGDAREAARLFDVWIEEAGRQGIRSPEAHYNLGLARWATKDTGPAAYHVAESARLRSSPFGVLRAMGTLGEMERELGVQEPVSESITFRLDALLNRDWIIALATCAFWLLAGAALYRWLSGSSVAPRAGAMVAAALALFSVAALGAANHRYFGRYGVLLGEAGIPLYREAEAKDAKKLSDLPAGMVVAYGRTEGKSVELYRPVSGWVPESALRKLEACPPGNPTPLTDSAGSRPL